MSRTLLPLVVILSVSACGGGESPAPAQPVLTGPAAVVDAFFEAVKTSDEDAFGDILTPRALAGMKSGEGFQLEGDSLGAWALGEEIVAQGVAEVPVRATIRGQEQNMSVLLRHAEQAGWLVYGLRVSMAEVGEFTVDFEQIGGMVEALGEEVGLAFEEAFESLSASDSPADIEQERADFEAVQSVSLDEHEEAWRYDLNSTGRTALELVREIAEPCGLEVDVRGVAQLFEERLEFSVRDLSRVEALELVASELGVYPLYPDPTDFYGREEPSILTFERGKHPHPVTFSGPFLIEVEDLIEHVPHATGQLTLAVRALGIARPVLRFQDQMAEHLAVSRITSPGGSSLHAEEGVSFLRTPQVRDGYIVDRITVGLSGLLRPVERIRYLEGAVRLRVPVVVEEVAWEQSRTEPHDLGFRSLELVEWGETTRFRYQAKAWQVESSEIRMSPIAIDDTPLATTFADSMGLDEVLTASLQTAEVPARIDLKICTVEEVDYPFILERIPLVRHTEMPEELEELSFTGDGPVLGHFVRFTKRDTEFPEIELRLQNVSNKDVLSLTAEFVYFDADDAELGSFPHGLTGGYDFESSGPQAVVERGLTISEKSTAFFMPPETERIVIRVTNVEFADATKWER